MPAAAQWHCSHTVHHVSHKGRRVHPTALFPTSKATTRDQGRISKIRARQCPRIELGYVSHGRDGRGCAMRDREVVPQKVGYITRLSPVL